MFKSDRRRWANAAPGLIDAHGHVMDLGFAALRLDLAGTSSLRTCNSACATTRRRTRTRNGSSGFGWNQELWPEKRFPTAADLDAVVADRPVVLERVDGHAVVANSVALKAAGVTAATQAPAGGRIENGLFVDAARGSSTSPSIPKSTHAEMDRALAKAQEILLGFGVTGVGSMSTSLADWAAFRRAADSGRLQVRLMTYMTASRCGPVGPAADRLALRRQTAARRRQAIRGRRARIARCLAEAALCRQARHARAAVPLGCGDDELREPGGRGGLPDRNPRNRGRGECAGHHCLRDAVEEVRQGPALADRAFPDRRSGGHSAPRSGGNYCVDAADSSDERPANGGEAARARIG